MMRKWRTMHGKIAVLDLRTAYLQLQCFQTVQHKGKFYQLTRLGFDLNCAPKIMTAVLSKVLSLDPEINEPTDHYIDDILVNSSAVNVERVVAHLQRYGLQTKPPERFENACILGLQPYCMAGQNLL